MINALGKRISEVGTQLVASLGGVKGRGFGVLVACSLIATTAIIGTALTGVSNSPLAALLGASASADDGYPTPVTKGGDTAPVESGTASSGTSPTGGSGPAPSSTSTASTPTATTPADNTDTTGDTTPDDTTPEETTPTTPTTPVPTTGRIKHVFVINLASPGYEASFGAISEMPYLSGTLRPQGQLLSRYSLLDRAALPNSIAMVSGQAPNNLTKADCPVYKEFKNTKPDKLGLVSGDGCVYPSAVFSIADQLTIGQYQWRAYMQDMADDAGPHSCVHPGLNEKETLVRGGYSTKLNPFVFYRSLLDFGDCALGDLPLDQFETDIKKTTTTADYSFISPNTCKAGFEGECDDGTDGASSADQFLSEWVPKIQKSAAYKKDGLLIITFGALEDSAATSNRVGALLLSKFVTPGATDETKQNPYSMLRTTEDLFGLAHLGNAAPSSTPSFADPLLGVSGGD